MFCQLPEICDHSRTYTGTVVGTPLTIADWLVPVDCEYTSRAPGWVPTHSQYCVTPVPLVQVNVTVDEEKLVPGTGEIIWAKAEPPGVLVAVGVSDGPAVDVAVAVGVGVLVAVAVGLPAGVEVTAPGPYA